MKDWYKNLDSQSRKYVRKIALVSLGVGFFIGAVLISASV